ncbi:MFS transporter [Nocardiopsis sp. MG754419]|uniref:MFS transporter n=1 Tax=Nocardiopsis sp. MG754419 TaxID=2259865 RepID=UPI001BA444C6|nr:MFS transporter [Nocardiopsis sp. MG754419]MBR8743859.1 MFS transporter [Nocardiopsis sp. MG754419]
MSSPHGVPTYRAVLRVTGVARFLAPALVGRLSYGILSPALVLSIVHSTGSYAHVGLVMGLLGLTVTVLSPLRASLIDRHGPRRALPPMAGLHALALTGLAATTWNPGAHPGVLAALAMVAGACAPPLGPVTRSVWSHLCPDRALLQRAYSLDTVVEELILLTGPLMLGALLWAGPPSTGPALCAVLVSAGTVGMVTTPVVRAMADTDDTVRTGSDPSPSPAAAPGNGVLLTDRGGFLSAVAVSAAMGLTLGAAALLNVAFAEGQRAVEAVVLVASAQAGGSALGGLAYGAVAWRCAAGTRSALLAAALGASVAAVALAPGLPALVILLFVAGVFAAPLLTTAYLLADASVRPRFRTRAGNWVNTAFNAGAALGGASVGLLLTGGSPSAGYAPVAAPLLLVALVVLVSRGRKARSRTGPALTSGQQE